MIDTRPTSHSRSVGRTALMVGGAVAMLLLSGCDKKAEGQVVAVVNGDEITAQELNGELGAAASQGEPSQEIRNVALGRVIDRRLLAGVAKEEGVETSPEYILRKRNLEENLLVQMMADKEARAIKQATPQQLQQLISENPQAFASRTVFALDQVVFPTPSRPDVLNALRPTKTMADVVAVLNKFGIKFQRGNSAVDSVNLPPQVFQQFVRTGSSEPIILPNAQVITVAMVTRSEAAPVTGEAARNVAANAYAKREVGNVLKRKLDAARKAGKIEYQSGFAAPAQPTAAGGAAAPAAPAAAKAS